MATVGQCSTVWESGTTLADISHTRGESNALVALPWLRASVPFKTQAYS
jgi:hypothetical protein